NLHQLGPEPDHPQVRFPGGYGGGMSYYCARRTIVFRTEHTRRSLVERVDYISAAGSSAPEVLRLGGPSKVITPRASFRLDTKSASLSLECTAPPYSAQKIRENTGCDLGAVDRIPATAPPTEEELTTLRKIVRRKMIDTGTYAAWAERTLSG